MRPVNTAESQSGPSQNISKKRRPRKQLNPIHQIKPIQQIKYYQNTTCKLIPRLPFGRLLKEIFQEYGTFRTSSEALDALQEASEMYLVQLFEDAYRCTAHRSRKTLTPIDIQLVRFIRGLGDVGNM